MGSDSESESKSGSVNVNNPLPLTCTVQCFACNQADNFNSEIFGCNSILRLHACAFRTLNFYKLASIHCYFETILKHFCVV